MQRRPVRFQGDPDVVAEVEALLKAEDDVEYVRTEVDDSAGIGADFDLETLSTVVALVPVLFFEGPVLAKLYRLLRPRRGSRFSIETPTGSVTIAVDGEFSEAALGEMLRRLAS
jgi:hypothetical protein